MTDVRLFSNRTMCVAGPSHAGKTEFVKKLLKYKDVLFKTPIRKVKWYYGVFQPDIHNKLRTKGYLVKQGLPHQEDVQPGDLIVLDDLMQESSNSKDVTQFFIRTTHHRNAFVIYITQNLFDSGKDQRTRSLSTQYLVIFKNPRDASQIHHLARQILPHHPKTLTAIYNDATSKPYGYLFIDMTQECPENLRYRTNFLPNDDDDDDDDDESPLPNDESPMMAYHLNV